MCLMFQLFFTISLRFENETKLKIKIIQRVMVNKSSVSECLTNHATGEKGTVFELPTEYGPWSEVQMAFFSETKMTFRHKNMYSSVTNTSPIISWREIITDTDWLAAWIPFRPLYLKVKRLLMFLKQNVCNKTTRLHENQTRAALVLYDRVNW